MDIRWYPLIRFKTAVPSFEVETHPVENPTDVIISNDKDSWSRLPDFVNMREDMYSLVQSARKSPQDESFVLDASAEFISDVVWWISQTLCPCLSSFSSSVSMHFMRSVVS